MEKIYTDYKVKLEKFSRANHAVAQAYRGVCSIRQTTQEYFPS